MLLKEYTMPHTTSNEWSVLTVSLSGTFLRHQHLFSVYHCLWCWL